jgi:hypothetical protein
MALLPRISVSAACLSVALAAGCGSSNPLPGTSSAGSSAAGGSSDTSVGGTGAGGSQACAAPGYPSDSPAIEIDGVDAQLSDPSGTPVPDLAVQVCGLDICLNDSTDAQGKVRVTPRAALLSPAFKYGDGFEFAKLAAKLSDQPTQDLGALVALPLPSYAEGAPFPKAGDVSSGDVTLSLAPGGKIAHDLLTYADDSQLVFRSVPIPIAASARALAPIFGFELAYALAPVSTTFCPPAALRLKNSLGWAPHTAVEVFVQGLEVDEKFAPYGDWIKVADASVSDDGTEIKSSSGGISILSSLALRRK